LAASEELGFEGRKREEVYRWVDQTLRQQGYQGLKRSGRGSVRRYVEKMTGLSRAQTSRLTSTCQGGDAVKLQAYRRCRFAQRYTRADIALLAGMDEVHGTLGARTGRPGSLSEIDLVERRINDLQAIYGGIVSVSC
jgi:hypothetical protein